MLARTAYYWLKPVLPWWLRISARQVRATIKRSTHRQVWPISPSSFIPPENWAGWPEKKRFAVVLTHDVEGSLGVSRVEQLMKIEQDLGFTSSFNFVPEAYSTPKELRHHLLASGFEVGVHGLKHDGKLYSSREVFRSRAKRINEYLRDWKAVGFRSPFMHHNLDWIHDLEIEYDASTFDTDPFEPQPDGMDTIFPFWVPNAQTGGGYMEMPYTLVQDFTLFTVLKEKTIDVWKNKVDWIVKRGGMVLLNVHPDYVSFEKGDAPEGEFPARHYHDLLKYIQDRYPGEYWHGLAKDLSAHCKPHKPLRPKRTGRHVCMLAYSHYESDNRIKRYATALADRGDHVEVLSLGDGSAEDKDGPYEGVYVSHLQTRLHNERGKWDYLRRLLTFSLRAGISLTSRHFQHRFDAIHVHNVPDFLVLCAVIPRLTGAKVILDIHDIVPEFFESKFKAGPNSILKKTLLLVEKICAAISHHVIISNHLWYDKITKRSVKPQHCSTYINYIDLGVFAPRIRRRFDDRYIVIFPGGFQWHQGLDLAIRAFSLFVKQVPNAEFHVYGKGDQREALEQLVKELHLSDSVQIHPPVPTERIPELLAEADLGVVPKRANSFGNEAYSTKIMEFMSQGLPVVVSRTKIDSFYFTENEVRFFESENVEDLANAMLEVASNPGLRKRLAANGYRYVAENGWGKKKTEYLALVDGLIEGKDK